MSEEKTAPRPRREPISPKRAAVAKRNCKGGDQVKRKRTRGAEKFNEKRLCHKREVPTEWEGKGPNNTRGAFEEDTPSCCQVRLVSTMHQERKTGKGDPQKALNHIKTRPSQTQHFLTHCSTGREIEGKGNRKSNCIYRRKEDYSIFGEGYMLENKGRSDQRQLRKRRKEGEEKG